MKIILFEDSWVGQLAPITLSRPAFAIRCGGSRLIDQLAGIEPKIQACVRPYLANIVARDFPQLETSDDVTSARVLLVNARLAPSVGNQKRLKDFYAAGISTTQVAWCDDQIAAATVPADALVSEALVAAAADQLTNQTTALDTNRLSANLAELPRCDHQFELMEYPHDVIRYHTDTIAANLEARAELGEFTEVADGVFMADGAKLGEHTVCDTKRGPIVIESNVQVGPFSYLQGPLLIEHDTTVNSHAQLKHGVHIGHTCKVGGEIEASIIEPYSNKQHYGYLGHAYLGSWVNIGAGTSNSDLKNTYGEIRMQYECGRIETGMQFVGCFIGDYSKTAINTSIFTGKTIGVCSMLYGTVAHNVPSFVNYAKSLGDQITNLPPAVMAKTQARMFRRRNVAQQDCDVRLLEDLYRMHCGDRTLSDQPLRF